MQPLKTHPMLALVLVGACMFLWKTATRERAAPATGSQQHPLPTPTVSRLTAFLTSPADDEVARLIGGMRQAAAASSLEGQERQETALNAALRDDAAPDLLRALPPELREHALAMTALERWSRHDPRAALAWLASSGTSGDTQIDVVVRSWLIADFAALNRHLAALPAGEWRTRILNAAGYGALLMDMPEPAVRWLAQMPAKDIDPDLLDGAVAAWGKKDVVSAARWAVEQADPAVADRLLAHVAIGQARHDPAASIALTREVFPSGTALDRAAEGIALVWSETEPEKAAQWVASMPESHTHHDTLNQILGAWAERDLPAAQTWVAALPVASQRDEWLSHLATLAAREDPTVAIGLIEQISPGPAQEIAGPGVVREWARGDYEKATEWVLRLPAGDFRQRALSELEKVVTEDPRNG